MEWKRSFYSSIISDTNSNDRYVEIYTTNNTTPLVTINNGVASNNSTSIQINIANGNDYRIIMKKRSDNTQLAILYLYVVLSLTYVNSRFNDYAKLTDIPTEFDLSTKTTDDLNEGTTNKYYTDVKVLNYLTNNNYAKISNIPAPFDISTKTTDDLNEGATNKYYDDFYVESYLTNHNYAKISNIPSPFDISTKTTDDLNEGAINKYIVDNTYNNN